MVIRIAFKEMSNVITKAAIPASFSSLKRDLKNPNGFLSVHP
jgi:hypothetical protein